MRVHLPVSDNNFPSFRHYLTIIPRTICVFARLELPPPADGIGAGGTAGEQKVGKPYLIDDLRAVLAPNSVGGHFTQVDVVLELDFTMSGVHQECAVRAVFYINGILIAALFGALILRHQKHIRPVPAKT